MLILKHLYNNYNCIIRIHHNITLNLGMPDYNYSNLVSGLVPRLVVGIAGKIIKRIHIIETRAAFCAAFSNPIFAS